MRKRALTIVLLLFSVCVFAQHDSLQQKTLAVSQPQHFKGYQSNRIVIGNGKEAIDVNRKLLLSDHRSIVVSNTVFKEVSTAVNGIYNINNRLAGIKVGNQNKQGVNLTSNVGLKGWEANAVGSFSKRRGSTFNLKYQYSVEDMLMNGMGHRLRLVTNF